MLGHGCQALGLEEFDAGALMSEVGLETAEDDGGCWTEVKDFRVPLFMVSLQPKVALDAEEGHLTLSSTFSSEFGQSMAKQTKSRSVSG